MNRLMILIVVIVSNQTARHGAGGLREVRRQPRDLLLGPLELQPRAHELRAQSVRALVLALRPRIAMTGSL